MKKTVFHISKMDCPSEENLIRLKIEGMREVVGLDFDIESRKLSVFHQADIHPIQTAISELDLGEKIESTEQVDGYDNSAQSNQRKLLWAVLGINLAFFIIEMISGLFSKSMGLVADSLDMFADALVYGMSLLAVGGSLARKKSVATFAGYAQIVLATLGFGEIIRRFFGAEKLPDFATMIIVSTLALIANGLCLYLLQQAKNKEEAHMKASMIFTSNDVIINLGVIIAALAVYGLSSGIPDLIVGGVVFGLVIRGAFRILKLGK
ncbi:MAG: cation transporter [Bacteroidia bacterium]